MKECEHEQEYLERQGAVREDGYEVEVYYKCSQCGAKLTWSYGHWEIEDS